jgi:hypothetical protein
VSQLSLPELGILMIVLTELNQQLSRQTLQEEVIEEYR